MNDEIENLVKEVARKLEWFTHEAERMKAQSWPHDDPCLCADDDGWTYARILRAFPETDKVVFRLPRNSYWCVFPNRASFSRFARFVNKHPWML